MDPVSATSFIVSQSSSTPHCPPKSSRLTAPKAVTLVSCVNVVSQLHDTREKYKDAEITIGELTAQTTLVRYALERIQRLFLENPRAIASKLQAQDHTLFRAFDTALVGSDSRAGAHRVRAAETQRREEAASATMDWEEQSRVE